MNHLKCHSFDGFIGVILRFLIIISIIFILGGFLIFIFKGGASVTGLTPVFTLFSEMFRLNAAAFITLGIYTILLMPIAIVIISFTHFIAASERKPILACLILLAMLAASIFFTLK